jgi:diguanylate cyclase (GGDEF)-like protein/PAS domain S-box-containing protein
LWQERHLEFAHGPIKLALDITELRGGHQHQGYILTVRDISEHIAQQQKLEQQARELELLDRVRTVVASQLNLAEVMRGTVEAVAEVFGYKLVSVYLREQDMLVLQYQVGYPKVIEQVPISKGVIGKVLRSGQPALITNIQEAEEFLEAFEGIRSEVAVPLVSQGKVTGVLNLESTEFIFDQSDVKVMMSLSEHIGMAIEKAKLYEAISSNEKQLRLLTENMNDLICLHTLDGSFSYVSPSSRTLLGYEPSELMGGNPIDLIHPDDVAIVAKHFEVLLQGQIPKPITYRCRQKTSEYIWLEVFAQPIYEKGQLSSIIASSRNVTERKRMEEQMLEGALLYDALTGLPNRVLFMDRLQQALNRRHRSDEEFAIMFLDLDRFKAINDSLGHRMGDLLLIEVAKRIQSCVRSQDTVARLGGDEFAILLERVSHQELKHLSKRIQQTLQQPFRTEGHEMNTSASIGIILGEHSPDPESLLRHADMAMYQAKNNGKARYMFFDESMHKHLKETMRLGSDLRKCLERSELDVYYQPIMSLDKNSLVGFEALLRWQHPERGLVLPNTFIPIAEEIGLIGEIDLWVLRQACQQLYSWQKSMTHPLMMSVNVSSKSLLRTDFLERLWGFIQESNIQPQQLKLEITESILMDHVASKELLMDLRRQGIGLMIDDFGTGYSSLSYLQRLPLDFLKIDRSFIHMSESNKQIVSTIILLAHGLELDVVAEGIETPEQLEYLRKLSCRYGQGYLFGKPMSAIDTEKKFLLAPLIL